MWLIEGGGLCTPCNVMWILVCCRCIAYHFFALWHPPHHPPPQRGSNLRILILTHVAAPYRRQTRNQC